MNTALAQHLDEIADYYIVASDPVRSRSFRSSARNIELLPFEVEEVNINEIKFQGLGPSTVETIREFIEKKATHRLDKLKEDYPPFSALSLLKLKNIDLKYIYSLWREYKVSSIEEFNTVPHLRSKFALKALEDLSTEIVSFSSPELSLLGDCAVQSAFGNGTRTINDIAEKLVELGDKHIFVADCLMSPNIIGGITHSRFESQKEAIRKAQVAHNIRIFQGLIVDLDITGRPIADLELLNKAEFIILKIATHPHEAVLSRLTTALSTLDRKTNVIIDCLDVYCESLNKEKFIELLKWDPILALHSNTPVESSAIVRFLEGITLSRVALMSYASTFEDLEDLVEASQMASYLGIQQSKIINCLPRPFGLPKSANKVGTRAPSRPDDKSFKAIAAKMALLSKTKESNE